MDRHCRTCLHAAEASLRTVERRRLAGAQEDGPRHARLCELIGGRRIDELEERGRRRKSNEHELPILAVGRNRPLSAPPRDVACRRRTKETSERRRVVGRIRQTVASEVGEQLLLLVAQQLIEGDRHRRMRRRQQRDRRSVLRKCGSVDALRLRAVGTRLSGRANGSVNLVAVGQRGMRLPSDGWELVSPILALPAADRKDGLGQVKRLNRRSGLDCAVNKIDCVIMQSDVCSAVEAMRNGAAGVRA